MVAPHNPMGPLATAVNVHFQALAQPNFKILEYRLPEKVAWAVDPYLRRRTATLSSGTVPAGGWRSTRKR